jgi:cobalt-zinc-cadmium efflux system outer membrane protein
MKPFSPRIAIAIALMSQHALAAPDSPPAANGASSPSRDALRPPEAAGPTFTIDAAVMAMKREQPLLRAANSAIHVAEGNAITTGHWTNPVADASWMLGVRKSTYDPIGTPTVGVTQFLELAGAPAARRRSAEAEMNATVADRDAVVRDLEWGVREAFVHLVASYERERIRKTAVADLEHAQAIVHSRVGGGLAPRYDASRIDIALEQARADTADSGASIVRSRADLDVIVGPAAGELVGLPRFDLATPPAIPGLPRAEDAVARRPDVIAARERVTAAEHDIDAARKSVFPGLGVRLATGYGQGPGQVDVGLGVVVPLPVIERGQGTVLAANARAEQNQERARALAFAVTQRIRAAHAELAVRVEAARIYRENLRTLNENARSEAEAGYREAKLSVLELVDAYQSLRDARLRLVDLSEAAHVANIDLGRALGSEH